MNGFMFLKNKRNKQVLTCWMSAVIYTWIFLSFRGCKQHKSADILGNKGRFLFGLSYKNNGVRLGKTSPHGLRSLKIMENVEYSLYSKEYQGNTIGIPREYQEEYRGNTKEYLSKRQRVLHDVRQSISQIEFTPLTFFPTR